MLDLRTLKFDRIGIAMAGKVIDDRSAGIAESQELGHLIESLASGVVASMADVLVGPRVSVAPGEIEMCVSTGDDQRENRKLKF